MSEPEGLAPYPRFIAGLARFALQALARVRVEGVDDLPTSGPLIIAANHMSNADPPFIGGWLAPALQRRPTFLAKEALFNGPLAIVIRSLGAEPVKAGGSDIGAYRAAKAVLDRGGVVAILPEGTRSFDGRPGRAQAGRVPAGHADRCPGAAGGHLRDRSTARPRPDRAGHRDAHHDAGGPPLPARHPGRRGPAGRAGRCGPRAHATHRGARGSSSSRLLGTLAVGLRPAPAPLGPATAGALHAIVKHRCDTCRPMGTVAEVRIARRTGFCYGVREAIDAARLSAAAGHAHAHARPGRAQRGRHRPAPRAGHPQRRSELDEVEEGAAVVIRAHGVTPEVMARAEDRGLDVIDGTCSWVTPGAEGAGQARRGGLHGRPARHAQPPRGRGPAGLRPGCHPRGRGGGLGQHPAAQAHGAAHAVHAAALEVRATGRLPRLSRP